MFASSNGLLNPFMTLMNFDALVLVTVDKDIKRFKHRLWELAERSGYRGNLTFEATDEPIIGGAIIYNEEKTIKFDMTIRSIIKENYGMIAQKLHRMLKEAGDGHE